MDHVVGLSVEFQPITEQENGRSRWPICVGVRAWLGEAAEVDRAPSIVVLVINDITVSFG